jgi:hypothetical protein
LVLPLFRKGVLDGLTRMARLCIICPAHAIAAEALSSVSNSTKATFVLLRRGLPWRCMLTTGPAAAAKKPRMSSSPTAWSTFATYTVRVQRSTSSSVCGSSCGLTGITDVLDGITCTDL